MIWEGHWWGTVLKSESEEDNKRLRILLSNLKQYPSESYEDGELQIMEENGLTVVHFNR